MSKGDTLILTPTARLARAELQRQSASRVADGQSAWRPSPVLAFSSWLHELREDYFLHADDDRVPIGGDQALVLWQSVIDRDVFIGEPRVAELAAGAWRLIHEYSLERPERWPAAILSEDAAAMREWARQFLALCDERGLVDEWHFAAELPALIAAGDVALPSSIRLKGFELPPTPLFNALIAAVEARGVVVEKTAVDEAADSTWPVHVFDQPACEMHAAASWARSYLEASPDARLAVVVPDLNGRVAEAERAFRQVFNPPGFALAEGGHEPWHISLGLPLSQWPIVDDALLILSAAPQRLSHPDARRIACSPFLQGADDEATARARLLTQLSERVPYWLDARELAFRAGQVGAERLGGCLTAWQRQREQQSRRARPSAWARAFSEELAALGYGRGRPLDSTEFQAWRRWQEILERFGMLDVVASRPLTRSRALKLLRERAAEAVFRERDPGAPVEILGVEEALGSRFDAVWITSLDQSQWPAARRVHPLIPPALQASVPAASVDGCLQRARQQLAGLGRCAPEIVGSFARAEEDAELSLLVPLQDALIESDSAALPAPVVLQQIDADSQAPAAQAQARSGGTGLLQRQSDCPFKAFAVDRLNARERAAPRPGLSPSQRGQLVHAALRAFWTQVDGLAALRTLSPTAREQAITEAVEQALSELLQFDRLALSAASRALESACLAQTLDAWLSLEAEREPFQVRGREHRIELAIGSLTLSGTIDRIDELEGGGSVLIDYKTGGSSRSSHWLPAGRMVDVQLPAYAVSMNPAPVAVSFAKVRADSREFSGLAEVETGMPGVAQLDRAGKQWTEMTGWHDVLDYWRESLDSLADEFLAGEAAVAPRDAQVCRRCHLTALCRIHERIAAAAEDHADD